MLTRCIAFFRGLLRRGAIDAEVDEELAFHLEQEMQMHLNRGVPRDEARRLAAVSLGGFVQTRDAVRDVRTTGIEAAWRETRQGIRTLWATPAFTVPAAFVLSLGIGGTTAVFSVLDGVLLRPLPYPEAGELVRIWSRNDERRISFLSVSAADFEDWRARASALRQIAAYERPRVLPLRDSGEPVNVMGVTLDLFPTLGIAPAIGRGFRSEDRLGTAAVISHELWQRRFGGVPDAIGRPLSIGENAWTVVGVMPPRFEVPIAPADVWVPLDTTMTTERFAHTLRVVARAAPGADAAAAVARDLEMVAAQLAVERPGENRGWSVTVLPLFDVVVSPEFRRSLWIVAGAVLFVLFMASMSAAALLLTRASGRQSELAVRTALGASRGSLVRLLLLESLVLGAISGLAGLFLAYWGVALLHSIGAASVPRLAEASLSGRVFAFAAATTLVSALGAGLLPAWRSTRSLHEMLRSRGDVSEPASARTLHTLVAVEVASAVLLVVGAALLVQTVLNLQRRDLGFDPRNLVAIDAIWPSWDENGDVVARTEDALSRLAALPGVTSVAAVNALPFSGRNSGNTFEIEGQSPAGMPLPDADYRVVSPGYFETLRIPVRNGRAFADAQGGVRGTVIISEAAARRFWPGGDAIGRRLKMGRSDWLTIVGIVGDARYLALNDPSDAVRPMLYVPHRQIPSTPMTLVVRSSVAPESLSASIRRTLTSEAGLGIPNIETMQGMLREASVSERFTMTLVTVFAATAVTLAVVGMYGLLGFLIARRTREIGLRVALGANHWHVVRMFTGRALLLVGVGVVAGLAASFALSEAVRSTLFGVSPHDPFTYFCVAGGFLALAIAAGTLPTLRALRIDPVRVIRAEC
jgi:putative ABC transport system permease protein